MADGHDDDDVVVFMVHSSEVRCRRMVVGRRRRQLDRQTDERTLLYGYHIHIPHTTPRDSQVSARRQYDRI